MFPLGTVVFPGTVIPLHVFEPRYRALTGWCVERDGRFGIVLIERGSEVGGGDARYGVGTQVRIVESVALPDGRWVLAAEGECRIRIARWLGEEPFPRAAVERLDDPPPPASAAAARDRLAGQLQQIVALLAELGEWPPGEEPPELDADPALAPWQLGELGLLGPADAQRLLETDGVVERLAVAAAQLDDMLELLALRARER